METQTATATRVTADEIRERLARKEQLTFVDARNPEAWSGSNEKLPGAIRIPAGEVAKHVGDLPRDRTIITYCT